jgi:hypothetical protein
MRPRRAAGLMHCGTLVANISTGRRKSALRTKPFAYRGRRPEARSQDASNDHSGLCIFLDITLQTWTRYRVRHGFTDITQRVDEIIRTQKFEGAAAGLLDANLIAREMAMLGPPGSGNALTNLPMRNCITNFARCSKARAWCTLQRAKSAHKSCSGLYSRPDFPTQIQGGPFGRCLMAIVRLCARSGVR